MTVLERAHSLAKRLLKGAANGHNLAHGLHARGEGVVGALELLKGKTRNLDHAVVDSRLKASRRSLGDVVNNLVQGVAHGELCGKLGDGETRSLRGERRGAAHARVHLDNNQAAVLGVHSKLYVGTTGLHAHLLKDGKRGHAHALVLEVRERLRGCHGNGVARVHTHGVEVLDGAHNDAVASVVAHDLHLVLFPALNGLLYQHLASRRKFKALGNNLHQLGLSVCDAAASTAQRKGRAQHARVAHALNNLEGVFHGVGVARARHFQANLSHSLVEELAVLAALDGIEVAANHLYAVLVEHACAGKIHCGVQARLATEGRQQRVGMLLGNNLLQELRRNGLHIGAVCQARVGHDGGGVGVEQHNLVAVFFQDLAGLSAGVVKLAGLANYDGARANDEDALDIGTLWHVSSPRSRWPQPYRRRSSNQPDGLWKYRCRGSRRRRS